VHANFFEEATMTADTPMPSVGDAAPPLDSPMATGETFSLAAQRGRWVAVYFYPRANTPG
jgi:peroxiredoxin Q/BCP